MKEALESFKNSKEVNADRKTEERVKLCNLIDENIMGLVTLYAEAMIEIKKKSEPIVQATGFDRGANMALSDVFARQAKAIQETEDQSQTCNLLIQYQDNTSKRIEEIINELQVV